MNIKNFALTGLLFSSVVIANAQQKLSDGIGDNGLTVNQNAILELASKNKGLLHTRVTLETTTKAYPMSAHVAGLMVYNTETRNDVVPGIYYNDGTKWVLASGGKATSISYNPTTFEISFVDASGNPVTIDFKEVVKKNETITTLISIGEGKYEYTSENNTKTVINVPADVIQNFETIVKQDNVKNEIINLIKNVGGNVYYDGDKFTYVTTTGEVKEITIKEIVAANETETTLVKNTNGTYTYKNEKGIEVIIDIPASVVENFETIVNKGPVTVNGNTFQTVEEYIQHIANSSVALGGSDFITVSGTGTAADPYKINIKEGAPNSMLVTNAEGKLEWATIQSIVKGNETVTTLVALGEGKYKYTSENGTETVINVPSDVIQNFETIVKEENVKNEIINLIKNVGGNVYYDGDKFTYVTETGETKEITIKEIVQANETVTTLVSLGEGKYEYTSENGTKTVINVPADVVQNFETIVKEENVKNEIINLIKNVGGNVYYDGDKFTYVTETGETKEITIKEIVQANETVTTLVSLGEGKYEYTSENGTKTVINVPADVVQNFETIVKEENVKNEIINLIKNVGGNVYYDGDKFTYVTETGETKEITIKEIVQANETVTTLVSLGEGKYEYTSENGTKTVINVPADVVQNFETIVKEENVKNEIINLIKNVGGNVYYDGDKFTYVTETGETKEITIKEIVQANETVTTLVSLGEGKYEYTSENGTKTVINVPADVVQNFETIVKEENVKNEIINLIKNVGGNVYYDGDKFTYVTTTGETKEITIKEIVQANETVTVLVKNSDGTFTYYNEDEIAADGTPLAGATGVTIDPKDVSVSLNQTTNVYEFKNSNGDVIGTIDMNAGNVAFDNTNNNFTSENVQDALEELLNKIENTKGNLVVAGGLEFTGGTTGLAKLLADANIQIADGGVTTAKLDDKAVTADKLDGGAGVDGRVGVAGADGTITYKTLDEVVKANETVTVLVKNSDGTFTYYNEDEIAADGTPLAGATGVTIDPKDVSVSLNQTTNVYEFKNSNGDVIGTIDMNAGNVAFDNTNNNFTSENVQDALEELLNKIENTKGNLVVAGGLEFTGGTTGLAKLLADANIQIADGGVTTAKLDDKAVTADKLDGGAGVDGRVGVAGADGTITYKTLDEVVKANETVTVLVKNSDGTFTYYNEDEIAADGTPLAGATGVTIDPKDVSVSLNQTTNVYEFKNSNGDVIGTIDMNAGNVAFDNTNNNFTSENVQDALEELLNKIENTKGNLVVAGGLEFTGGTTGLAKLLADANIQIADGGVTTAKLDDKAVTADKLDGGAGVDGRVGVAGADGTITYKTLDEVVKANETVTVLVKNSDGTFTYYNEDEIAADGTPLAGATGVTIDPKDVSVSLNQTTNVYEFKNSNGDVIGTIDMNAGNVAFDNTNNNFTSENVQDALEELLNKIENTKGNLVVAGGLEFTGGTTGLAKLLADANIQIADGGVTTAKLDDKAVTADKLDGGAGVDGRVGVAGADGTITYKTLDEVVKANQKTVTVVDGTNTTVTSNGAGTTGNNTEYQVNVSDAAIQAAITLAGDVTGKVGETKVEGIQGTPVSATAPTTEGQALVYNGTQWVPGTPKVDVGNVTDAKNLTTDGIIVVGDAISSTTSAASTLLAAAKLSVKNESITTAQIQNGTIKPEDIAVANKDQVLVTNASGNPIWVDQSTIATKVEANNGLGLGTDAHAGKVQLGGELIRKTTITTTADHTLAIAGLDKKKVQATDATDGIRQHLLAVGSDNVVKALKAAMPKFFYMPSVMVPTAESQLGQAGVTYNNSTRTGTIQLYDIYKTQFGTPVISSTGASPLPVLPASELGYHITFATSAVFTIQSITATGLLTYTVSPTADITNGSFINIVFSVKED